MDRGEIFLETLKDLINESCKSPKEISSDLKINRNILSSYLSRNSLPQVSYAIKLSEYFNCSLDYLFGYYDFSRKNQYDIKLFYPNYCKILKQNNITNYALCAKLKISIANKNRWKNGTVPTMSMLLLLADFFECGLDYFFIK